MSVQLEDGHRHLGSGDGLFHQGDLSVGEAVDQSLREVLPLLDKSASHGGPTLGRLDEKGKPQGFQQEVDNRLDSQFPEHGFRQGDRMRGGQSGHSDQVFGDGLAPGCTRGLGPGPYVRQPHHFEYVADGSVLTVGSVQEGPDQVGACLLISQETKQITVHILSTDRPSGLFQEPLDPMA